MEIRALGSGDESLVLAAAHLFDGPPDDAATARFLGEDGHHLLIAYEDSLPAGFISGVEMVHPDKGPEMFVYELGVDEPYRRRGVARALIERLGDVARERGCHGMWVVTESDNLEALATYEASGGTPEHEQVVLVWTF